MPKTTTPVHITSFGYLHGPAPTAHLTYDLRTHFRDPHVAPELRELTAHDAPVRRAVLSTPGIAELINAAKDAVHALRLGPSCGQGPVTVAIGCAGGRHRAATVAATLHERLASCGLEADLTHRDLHLPVVQR